MTNLTAQCKKGELPEGWYYLKVNEELANHPVIAECVIDYALMLPSSYFYDFDEAKIEQVLAPVPSYEEYTKLKEELKDYEYQHKQDGICYNDLFCKLELARKENAKLKEQQKLTSDCKTLAQKLLQVKPELREWLEVNFKEYL